MAEMLPLSQAKTVTRTLLDYLGTTFALADPDTRRVLDEFLQHPETGIFRGPTVGCACRSGPRRTAGASTSSGTPGFTPYGHQAGRVRAADDIRSRKRPRP